MAIVTFTHDQSRVSEVYMQLQGQVSDNKQIACIIKICAAFFLKNY